MRIRIVAEWSAALAGTLTVECWLTHQALTGGLPALALLAIHILLTAVLLYWTLTSETTRLDFRIPGLLVVTTAVMGPLGACGTLFTIALKWWYERKAMSFDEWYQSLFPDTERDASLEFLEKLILSEGSQTPAGVSAFSDILALGSLHQKQALVTLISRRFRPEFGPVLKQALLDPENAIRVQAATAMSKLETSFLERGLELTKSLKTRNDAASLLGLGRLSDEYAYSGILDARRQMDNRNLALDYYKQYLKLESDPSIQLASARLLLRNRMYAAALVMLDRYMESDSKSDQPFLWRMECLYELGQFDELRTFAARHENRLADADGLRPEFLESVRLWAA